MRPKNNLLLEEPSTPSSKIAFINLIEALDSEQSKRQYSYWLSLYLKFLKIETKEDLYQILEQDIKTIEKNMISYVLQLKTEGYSFATISTKLAAIALFYTMNDIVINRKKIGKYVGEHIKIKDRAYTKEEIQKIFENCDLKFKVVVAILASTGCRIGALPNLKIGDLKYIKKYQLHQITFYSNSHKSEYYSFTTPECSKYIFDYLEYRKRCGEKLNQNSPLIRNSFKIDDPIHIQHPKHLSKATFVYYIRIILIKAGLRIVPPTTTTEDSEEEKKEKEDQKTINRKKRERKPVSQNHGFRKFVHTTMTLSKVDIEIRELLLGHTIGLSGAYYRPTEQQCLEEYLKAVDQLTINDENRLKIENQELKSELELTSNEIEGLKENIVFIAQKVGVDMGQFRRKYGYK